MTGGQAVGMSACLATPKTRGSRGWGSSRKAGELSTSEGGRAGDVRENDGTLGHRGGLREAEPGQDAALRC